MYLIFTGACAIYAIYSRKRIPTNVILSSYVNLSSGFILSFSVRLVDGFSSSWERLLRSDFLLVSWSIFGHRPFV